MEVLVSCRRSFGRILQQQEIALDAQELRDAPALLVALGSRERLVDRRDPFGRVPETAEGVGRLGQEYRVVEIKRSLGETGQRGAQKLQPGDGIAALDQQHASESLAPNVPGFH